MEEKIPEIKHGHPIWWHHHGEKMIVSLKNSDRMIIKSNAAKIMIERARIRLPTQSELKDDWIVDWEIAQCRPYDEVVRGRRLFTRDDVRSAFGLIDDSGKYGKWLIDRYGAEAAEQMKYIRWGNFLNIPCPGTGNYGDPNISIKINGDIQLTVAELISQT